MIVRFRVDVNLLPDRCPYRSHHHAPQNPFLVRIKTQDHTLNLYPALTWDHCCNYIDPHLFNTRTDYIFWRCIWLILIQPNYTDFSSSLKSLNQTESAIDPYSHCYVHPRRWFWHGGDCIRRFRAIYEQGCDHMGVCL